MTDSKIILPLQVPLKLVISQLGLSSLDLATQAITLNQYVEDFNLIIKFKKHDREIWAQQVSDGLESVKDEHDNLTLLTKGDSKSINFSTDDVELRYFRFAENNRLSVDTIRLHEIDYYTIDKAQMHPEPLSLDLDNVYIDKEDLTDFQDCDLTKMPEWKQANGDYFAPEMVLAEQAHKAIVIEGYKSNLGSMENRTHAWLKDQDPQRDESRMDAQSKRISTIIGKAKKTG